MKGSIVFLDIWNFVSKMSDHIKFQKHVSFNYIISLNVDFVCCKEYQRSNQVSLNPVVSLTCLIIRNMMQFGSTIVKKRKMQKMVLTFTTRLKAEARVEIISTRSQVKQLFSEPPNQMKSIKNTLCLDMYLSFA